MSAGVIVGRGRAVIPFGDETQHADNLRRGLAAGGEQIDGALVSKRAPWARVDHPTMRVSLSRLAFQGAKEPHDWSAWAAREPVATKHKRGHNGAARKGLE